MYVAFLRGINVGGKIMKMADVKKVFESLGFENVKTVLASGNVLFTPSKRTPEALLAKDITSALEKTFGYTVSVIVRSKEDIDALVNANPFKRIPLAPNVRCYITFIPKGAKSHFRVPFVSPDGEFRILKATETEVMSVLTLTEDMRTTDAMAILEKEFGNSITTRNWNTVVKVAAL